MNLADLDRFVTRRWDEDLVPRLIDYVRVPAKSPAFDASWEAHGHLKAVIQAAEQWCRAQPIAGLTLEIVTIDGLTP
ncbi:MAG: peptidase M20, partial [Burkholderiaceae bacterium]